MLIKNAWLILPDRFRDLLEFVYCSRRGEIWLFNNDLFAFETPELFEELYSDVIDHSPIGKNIRGIKLLLRKEVVKKFKDTNNSIYENLCTLSETRLKTFYIGEIPENAFKEIEVTAPKIPKDVPYVFYTAYGTLQGAAANSGVILVRPTDHPFRDSTNVDRDHITVGWQVQDNTQATIEAKARLAKLFDQWFNNLSLFESIDPVINNGSIVGLNFVKPALTRKQISQLWHDCDKTKQPLILRRPKCIPSSVHFAVVTALEEEAQAVLETLEDVLRVTIDGTLYRIGYYTTKAGPVYRIAVSISESTGSVAASLNTLDVIKNLNPQYVFLLGIAATRKRVDTKNSKTKNNGVEVGDLVYSTSISPYEYTKIKEHDTEGRPDITREERTKPCSGFLISIAREVERLWTSNPPQIFDWPASSSKRNPKVFGGTIASGSKVIADQDTVKAIAIAEERWNRKLIAIEMESEGVAEACKRKGVEFILAKGISDYADKEKNDLWHIPASRVSAKFFSDMLEVIASSRW